MCAAVFTPLFYLFIYLCMYLERQTNETEEMFNYKDEYSFKKSMKNAAIIELVNKW